jgi:hypothetical protein
MSRRFGALCSIFIGRLDKTTYEDGTEGSETLAHKIQKPEDYQKKKRTILNIAKVWNQALSLLPYNDYTRFLRNYDFIHQIV